MGYNKYAYWLYSVAPKDGLKGTLTRLRAVISYQSSVISHQSSVERAVTEIHANGRETVGKGLAPSGYSFAICMHQNVTETVIACIGFAIIMVRSAGRSIEYRSIYNDKFSGYKISQLDNNYSRVVVKSFPDVLALAETIASIAEAEVVVASDSFGCCSRYEACSDAKKCIHPNPIFAVACSYKKNLEQ